MPNSSAVEVRRLTSADIPTAMDLKDLADWNQTERNGQCLIRLEPRGCFAACLDGRVVGTVTSICYGADLAWIGMMLVSEKHRRRGIGRRLMLAALEYLKESRVPTIKLDATPAGQPLYESMGFAPEVPIERWGGSAHHHSVTACTIFKE